MSNTTQQGVLNATTATNSIPEIEDAGAAAFLDQWKDEDQQAVSDSQEVVNEEPEEVDQAEGEESTEEETEETEDPNEESEETEETEESDDEPKKVLDDDALVEIKVDDENLKVSVKDLKRLYGQEAALTKKSQAIAAKRKEVEQEGLKLSATLEKLYQNAEAKWRPYAEIDMLVAAKTLDAEEFTALRQAANAAHEEFRFITEEVNSFVKDMEAKQQAVLREQAVESVKVLKEVIPSWDDELYNKIRTYAVGLGMDANLVNNLVDPVAIQIIHKARLYDEGKKIVTKKVVKAPKKVLAPSPAEEKSSKVQMRDKALSKLRNSGSTDAAMDAFLSGWQD